MKAQRERPFRTERVAVSATRKALAQDLAGYYPFAWLYERSAWTVVIYRIARHLRLTFGPKTEGLPALCRFPIHVTSLLLLRLGEVLTGTELPPSTVVGPGLRIWHGGNIVINPRAVIGANCLLRHGVTIGNVEPGGPVPRIGDNVQIGAYAQILGDVTVGDGARIGAMSLVLQDVPAGATAVGIPARIVQREKPGEGREESRHDAAST